MQDNINHCFILTCTKQMQLLLGHAEKPQNHKLAAVPVSNPVCLFSNVYFAFSSKHNSPFFEHFQCLWFPEFHHKMQHHHNKQLKYPSTTKLIVCKKTDLWYHYYWVLLTKTISLSKKETHIWRIRQWWSIFKTHLHKKKQKRQLRWLCW